MIKFAFLGGVDEFGENLTCYLDDKSGFIVDCGMKFAGLEHPGVSYFFPDFSYIKENYLKFKLLVITHSHEDHIGAVVNLLKEIPIKIAASKFAIEMIKNKIAYSKEDINMPAFIKIDDNFELEYDNFKLTFLETDHSIIEAFSVRIENGNDSIFHTADFKLSDSIKTTNYLKNLKNMKDTDLLLLDSTNSATIKTNLSEKKVRDALLEEVSKATQQVFITMFASNIERFINITKVARKLDKFIVLLGRSVEKYIETAKRADIEIDEDYILDVKQYRNRLQEYNDENFIFLISGSQGEFGSALSNLASLEYKRIKIQKGDTFIFSSKTIPGNEKKVFKVENLLLKKGVKLVNVNSNPNIHASGHADIDSIKKVINIISPKFYFAIHGDYSQQLDNENIAIDLGLTKENLFIPSKGELYILEDKKVSLIEKIEQQIRYRDITGFDDMPLSLIKERNIIKLGIVNIFLILNEKTGFPIIKPTIISRGFIYEDAHPEVMELLDSILAEYLEKVITRDMEREELSSGIIKLFKKYFRNNYYSTPFILPIIEYI